MLDAARLQEEDAAYPARKVARGGKHKSPRPLTCVGFAAKGTLARQIIDVARTVRLYGEEIPVHAQVHTINDFSAHADRDELLARQRQVAAARTFLLYGEEEVLRRFAVLLTDAHVEMPAQEQVFSL